MAIRVSVPKEYFEGLHLNRNSSNASVDETIARTAGN